MLTAIRQWVIRTMMKNNTGVVQTLPKKEIIELNTQITAQRLMQNGVDPDALKNADQVENIVNQIEKPKVIPADSAAGKGVTEQLLGKKKAEVFDLEGNKISEGSKIIGGKQIKPIDELENFNVDKEPISEKFINFTIQDINKKEPLEGMKIANKIIKREGEFKDLTEAQSQRILKETDDHLTGKDIDYDPEDFYAKGGRAGFAMGLGPRFLKLLNQNNPAQAYKKYLQSVKKRAQKGDMKSLLPEMGAVSAGGIFVNRRMSDVLESMKNQDMENSLENFTKELNADPFYEKYPELKDKMIENYTEKMFGEKRAAGGRIGYKDGPKIKVQASGSKTGKNQIEGAPEGITYDSESIDAIIKADIPISQKIDLLADYQYGKGRTRIDNKDQEIYMDEGGYKNRNVGLGYNQDGEGFGGKIMYNVESGDPTLNIRFKKSFANGGRIGLASGMTKRAFLKLMGGVGAGIGALKSGIFTGLGKGASKEVAKEVVKSTTSPPAYFFKLAEKIKFMGDETLATKDKAIAKKYKDYVMEEDFAGNIEIIKKGEDLQGNKLEDVYMSYKVDEVPVKGKKGSTKVEEYEEFTARPDGEGKMKDIEQGVPDEVIDEAGDVDSMTLKRAGGGIARMLGE